MSELTIAHLSDFHLCVGPGTWRDLMNKRLYGRLAWRRRRAEFDPAILDAMFDDLDELDPDLVVVTGDQTHLGRLAEYHAARELLETLGDSRKVLIIPGNHDAYVAGAWEAGRRIWAGYLCGDDGSGGVDGKVSYPVSRYRNGVEIIALNSALPRPWWLATGRLGRVQLAGLDGRLADAAAQGRARVLLVHHPPVPGLAGWRRRLEDEKALLEILAARGAELVLHGHIHRRSRRLLVAGKWRIPVFGVPAAAARGRVPERCSRYNLYRFGLVPEAGWRVTWQERRYSASRACFVAERPWCDKFF